VTEFEFIGKILSKTASPVAPMITVLEDQEKKRLSVEGAAVFKDDKMIGELDIKETRGLLWVTGEVETGIFNMGVLGQWASLEIREASSKLTAEITPEGAIAMRVEIHETSGIGDQKGKVNLADPEADTALLNAAEQAILDEAESALKKAKELGADIFGFGDEIARKYPRRWAEMEDRWDELFQDIEVRFEIKTRLDGTGRLSHPITPEDR
jgi:Ger(x)C family germination protein